MADFNFPGVDLSDPFLPSPGSVSVYSPFEYSTPKVAVKPPHDYGTFTYPLTPIDERPGPILLPLRSRNCSSNSPPSLSFSRSSSTSSKFSFSSSASDIDCNRLSNTKWASPTSFPHFASLPLDIQRTIWRHSLPKPQIIEIHQYTKSTPRSSSSFSTTTKQDEETLPSLTTRNPLPIALHINRLSRRFALSILTPLSFAHPYFLPSNPYAYINYVQDTIFISSHTLYPDLGNHILYSRNLHMIRYLALEFEVWCELLGDNHFVNALLEMEGLISIEIIFERQPGSLSFCSDLSSNNESSILSRQLEESIMNWGITHQVQDLRFVEPTRNEERNLKVIFERECEKKWLWGRVSGWEDVREKLSFRWKEEESKSMVQSRVYEETNDNENKSYKPLPSRLRAKDNHPTGFFGISSEAAACMGDEHEELDQGLESLMNSVDDVIMDYGYVAQGRGRWVDGKDTYADQDDAYSESNYSRCSASFEDDSDLEGWI
ncbi:uncharacterized protein Bfra_000112 [Botrytis fragariae]|uniref:2EXR domain-containing protein n=1 Tax=Botrytis fragariae TaxID=1964551 RepID=A0A8H6B2P4_9HELO|nr:uncharacterized protein Bfra_000112 [Botrytis fragariae]KAF5877947.1 hypothetical protein Bfra_000112 [Botrytis fragariae]